MQGAFTGGWGDSSVCASGAVPLLLLLTSANAFATPVVLHFMALREPGLPVLLGGGLGGLANLVRRHLSE